MTSAEKEALMQSAVTPSDVAPAKAAQRAEAIRQLDVAQEALLKAFIALGESGAHRDESGPILTLWRQTDERKEALSR